jgi:hypothetical protein
MKQFIFLCHNPLRWALCVAAIALLAPRALGSDWADKTRCKAEAALKIQNLVQAYSMRGTGGEALVTSPYHTAGGTSAVSIAVPDGERLRYATFSVNAATKTGEFASAGGPRNQELKAAFSLICRNAKDNADADDAENSQLERSCRSESLPYLSEADIPAKIHTRFIALLAQHCLALGERSEEFVDESVYPKAKRHH